MADTITLRKRPNTGWGNRQLNKLWRSEADALDIEAAEAGAVELGINLTPRPIKDNEKKLPKIKAGFVYLIRAESGLCKIGLASDVGSRLRSIRPSSPDPVFLIHVISACDCASLERLLHTRYAEKRIRGEWFDLTDSEIEWVKSLPVDF